MINVNKKLFHVSEGKSFEKFVKEVESSRNDSTNEDDKEQREALLKKYIKLMITDKIDWRKLK